MRMNAEPVYVHTDGVGEVRRATINSSAKIFNFFSKQIYSDFYTASWRELVANGIDGQRVNGCTRPPVVTVPSFLEPMVKVRDFGCSMDHEFMMNDFMCFGEASTKDTSDEMIGGFGIGSKAPLAYTDQYSIRCFMNGEVRVYSIFKDEADCPSIAFLSKDTTDEPDGVEVAFPVRQDDITKFTDTVVPTLQYFDPLPILENTDLKLEPVKYDAKGKRWGVRVAAPDRKAKLIVGGVCYPFDAGQIPWGQHNNLRTFANIGVDLYLDIGEVNIALSREHVTHDEKLFKRLGEIVDGIGEEFGKQMSKAFDSCNTRWEAQAKFVKSLENTDSTTANLLRKNAFWRGQKLETSIRRPKDAELLIIAHGHFSWPLTNSINGIITTQAISPKFRIWADHAYFGPTSFEKIVICDTDDKPMLRFRAMMDKHPGMRVLVLKDNSAKQDQDMAKVLKDMGSPPADMVDYLSKWTPLKVTRVTTGSSIARPFKCYVQSHTPHRGNSNRAQSALPTGGGLYIVMDNFSVQSSQFDIEVAKQLTHNNIVWMNLTDFKASGVEKLSDWLSVKEAVEKVKNEYKSKHKNLARAEAWYRFEPKCTIAQCLAELTECSGFPKRGPLAEIQRLQKEFEGVNDRSHSKVRCELLDVKWDAEYAKLVDLDNKAKSRYPHIAEITRDHYLIRKLSPSLINNLF